MIKSGQIWKSKHNSAQIKVVTFDPKLENMEYLVKRTHMDFFVGSHTVHIIPRLFLDNWELLSNTESIEGEMFI